MDEKTTRMVFATAALAAVAAVLAGPAGAYIPEGDGVGQVSAQSQGRQATDKVSAVAARNAERINEAFARAKSGAELLAEGQGAGTLQANATPLDPAIQTAIEARSNDVPAIPYLSQGQGVDESLFAGGQSTKPSGVHAALAVNRHNNTSVPQLPHGLRSEPLAGGSQSSEPQSLGLNGDSPLTRVSAPEPEGLTGDSALTRVPGTSPTPTVSGGEDIDWTSFGAGAGMVALLAAGLGGVLLTTRRRHTVGMP